MTEERTGADHFPAPEVVPLQISRLCGTDPHKTGCAGIAALEGVAFESHGYAGGSVPGAHPLHSSGTPLTVSVSEDPYPDQGFGR